MSFQIIQGTTGYINPAQAALDTGWTVSGGTAVHTSCNPGTMIAQTPFALVLGRQYTFTYKVFDYASNGVKLIAGTANGTTRTANGTYTETLTMTGSNILSFFSDGALGISDLKFYDTLTGVTLGTTISFNSKTKEWGSEYSYKQEVYIKFKNKFLSLNSGNLWLHNANQVRNNFNGVQYNSQVKLYANFAPTTEKQWYTVRVESNKVWCCPNTGDIIILPTEGKPAGMSSRLAKNRFNRYRGSYYADFLRNILDPRFTGDPAVKALFQAESLQGRVMELLFTNDDTVEVILFEIDFKSAPISITY